MSSTLNSLVAIHSIQYSYNLYSVRKRDSVFNVCLKFENKTI